MRTVFCFLCWVLARIFFHRLWSDCADFYALPYKCLYFRGGGIQLHAVIMHATIKHHGVSVACPCVLLPLRRLSGPAGSGASGSVAFRLSEAPPSQPPDHWSGDDGSSDGDECGECDGAVSLAGWRAARPSTESAWNTMKPRRTRARETASPQKKVSASEPSSERAHRTSCCSGSATAVTRTSSEAPPR